MKHPMQPIERDEQGTIRFRPNKIIRYLCDAGKIDLNALAIMPFENDDMMQLMQLLGYSVSGFGDLSFADPEVVAEADRLAEELLNSPPS